MLIKIKNELLYLIKAILSGVELDEKQSSARRRFLRDLKPFANDLAEARGEIQDKYAEKDEKGNPKLKGPNQEMTFLPGNKKKADKAWDELNREVILLDVTPANKADIECVAEILKEERKKISDAANGKFNADIYETLATIDETLVSLKPVKK